MKTQYPSKIILAWAEAVKGNQQIREWLMKNGYPELGIFVHALHNQDDAREWLMENDHPQLMALINGAEGNKNALLWLRNFGMDVLEKVALVADNNEDALGWLIMNDYKDFAKLALHMRFIKNEIDDDNADPHRFSRV